MKMHNQSMCRLSGNKIYSDAMHRMFLGMEESINDSDAEYAETVFTWTLATDKVSEGDLIPEIIIRLRKPRQDEITESEAGR